ncbi:hypothetical protein RHSIM_Rhsim03G0103300 [Rhododendron simsii]|uniref:PGG domain-containing protein n=1 Tax=Rhododendron simsii TaxID=118357 RepID=A0A834H935_RHOSS|nr:hypothetical protein RHSIM_Rhsim03G0103300 [Rhododendron simsii]
MKIIQEDPNAIIRAQITGLKETALMVAVQSAGRNDFASKLLEKMTPEDVLLVDHNGDNALHWAAYYGNIEGAKMLVNKNPNLPNVLDDDGDAPLHSAAVCGFRDMVFYLMEVTSEDVVLTDKVGVQLLRALTSGELYDIALTLVERKPELARCKNTPLDIIGEKHSSFRSGYSLNFWQILIYSGVPIKTESIANNNNGGGRGDIESPANCCISVRQRSHFMFWKVAETLVPHIRCIREKKLRHHHALELVKVLCNEVTKLNPVGVRRIFSSVLQKAKRMGIHEIVEEIILSFPMANFYPNHNGQYTLQDAILWRRERVFNLIYQMDHGIQPRFISNQDKSSNNGLHLAALLDLSKKSISEPVLLVQFCRCSENCNGLSSRLQFSVHDLVLFLIFSKPASAGQTSHALVRLEASIWVEVEKFTAPGDKEKRNANGMTPAELFSDTHQNLVKDGEQWMKDTATSCTIVAALIATMVFTAAITVPGGNNSNGHLILSKQKVFIIFGISDALALFSSITSALMFLLILTSRYAEEDFLHTLPKRLIIGLVTLFVSILFTMVAFGAILYLVFGDNKAWIFIPVTALASIPITLFGALQFPLLVEMFQSTYGRGIFGKQNDRVLQ